MIARVLGVMTRSTCAGSMLKLPSSMSAKTGRAPVNRMLFTEAMNVNGLVITSSPGPIPLARRARCSAVVPEDVARACLAPVRPAKASSKAATRGPCASMPESSTSSTACFSRSPIQGREIGIGGGCEVAGRSARSEASFDN